MATPVIDPKTGERISNSGSSVQIDPATGERISASDPQMATMGPAQPRGATGYVQDVSRDLLQGGNRTIVGQGLGYLQGNGGKGYSGLESGVSPDTAQFMGSIPLGVTKTAQGVTEIPSHPLTGTGHIVSGALQAATIPASFVAPEAAEPLASQAVKGAGKVTDAIAGVVSPGAIKEAAGGLLQSVAHDANKIPVQLDNAGDAALSLMDWQKKTQLGPTLNKFLNRITNPKMGPMTYEEARDYYQLLGRMSVEETNKLAPPVQRDLAQMVAGLKQDIGNAADQVGRAADYYKGLGDYARGAKYQEWYDAAKEAAIKGALTAAGAGAAGGTAYKLWQWFTGK